MAASMRKLALSGQYFIRGLPSTAPRYIARADTFPKYRSFASFRQSYQFFRFPYRFSSPSKILGQSTVALCAFAISGISFAKCWGFGYGSGGNTKEGTGQEEYADSTDRVYTSDDAARLNLTLYQYQVCPFCCKVRAFLDFYGIKYTIVEVEPVLRKELKFSEYRKVPILLHEDAKGEKAQMNDSSAIISALTTMLSTEQKDLAVIASYYPKVVSEKTSFWGRKKVEYMNRYDIMLGRPGRSKAEKEEKQWREWVDGVLVHYIAPNIYRTRREALEAFDYIGEMNQYGPFKKIFSKYFGAAGMYFVSIKLKKKYNLKEDVRESLYDASRDWMAAVGDRDYMGGAQPNLADLAVYGILSSIEGLDAFNDVMRETPIGPWYKRTKQAVVSNQGSPEKE